MSFQQALSGLNGASSALETISNNLANSTTVGFKQSQVQFADMYAASLAGTGVGQIGMGAKPGAIAQQFTQGNISTTNNPLDLAINGQGFFQIDNNGAFSYSRNGQFHVDQNGYVVNASSLKLTGYLPDAAGNIVQGPTPPLRMDTSNIQPKQTTTSELGFNLDSRKSTPASMTQGALAGNLTPASLVITAGTNDVLNLNVDGVAVTGVQIPAGTYTSSTNLAVATQTAINAALGALNSTASVSVTLDAASKVVIKSSSAGTIGSQGTGSSVTLTGGNGATNLLGAAPVATTGVDNFNPAVVTSFTSTTAQTVYDISGTPYTFSSYFAKTSEPGVWQMYTALNGLSQAGNSTFTATALTFNSAGNLTTTMPLSFSFATPPLAFTLDMTGSTQYGIDFGVNQSTQDGYATGNLAGISVSPDGTLQGQYSNGRSKTIGQIVLTTFNNPNALLSVGGNQWQPTLESGSPITNPPGTGILGVLQASAVEESNVDMTKELVNMITEQRAYQANAQSIKTQDQILQTLVNLR